MTAAEKAALVAAELRVRGVVAHHEAPVPCVVALFWLGELCHAALHVPVAEQTPEDLVDAIEAFVRGQREAAA